MNIYSLSTPTSYREFTLMRRKYQIFQCQNSVH